MRLEAAVEKGGRGEGKKERKGVCERRLLGELVTSVRGDINAGFQLVEEKKRISKGENGNKGVVITHVIDSLPELWERENFTQHR